MQKKRRTPRGSAMDGFVRRSNPMKSRRASLDGVSRLSNSKQSDGFVEHQDSKQPMQFADETDTLNSSVDVEIDDQNIELGPDLNDSPKSFKWWQFKKKRAEKKRIKAEKRTRKHKIIKRILLILVLIALLVGGFLGWKVLKNTNKIFNGNVLGFFDSTKLKGEENGRVNILLAGTSEDDPGHDGAKLTDSIMIVSVDTVDKTAFMLSIPRDLWVSYQTKECSVGYQGKINAVYTCGEQIDFSQPGYPTGGMGLLEKVVEDNFGIDINYHAKINYTAFHDAVDAVGGININLKTNDPRGILDRIFDWECKYKCYKVKYPNGPLKLNGEQALDLARARGDIAPTYGTGNDFGRTERQRQMLVALKDKALSVGILTNPAKISGLLDAAGDNVDTDFKTNELRRLYDLGKDIKSDSIKSIGLTDENVSLVETFSAVDGSSAVRPTAGTANFSQIKSFIKKLISNDPVVREGARVVVLNGSGTIGLAQKKADMLEERGITIEDIGNATARQNTIILDLSDGKMQGTKSFLQKQFVASSVTDKTEVPEAAKYDADFIIVLGKTLSSSQN